MFGVLLDGPSDVTFDNQVVVNNMSLSQYTLVKKHKAVYYHVVRKTSEVIILRLGKEDTETDFSGLPKNIFNEQGFIRVLV